MARYAITILTIAAIILAAAGSAGAVEPRELTVLAYNTHLFEDSIFECICRCGGFTSDCQWGDYFYQDETRRDEIVSKIANSGADIVVLQEVWARCWQWWFGDNNDLDMYVQRTSWDSSCWCEDAVRNVSGLYVCLYNWPLDMICNHCCLEDCCASTTTLGNALVLLSKYPLHNLHFERFPTYKQCPLTSACETWADKGVITADVNVDGLTIRLGVSHARYVTFQMAEVLVSKSLFYEILERIKRLKPIPIGYG